MSARRTNGLRALVAFVLVGAASLMVVRAWEKTRRPRAIGNLCDAVAKRDWPAARATTVATDGTVDALSFVAVECQCAVALIDDDPQACTDQVEALLLHPAADGWVLDPTLARLVIDARQARGALTAAAAFAERAVNQHPEDPGLFARALVLGALVDDERAVLERFSARLADARFGDRHLHVATRHLLRHESDAAIAILGRVPPDDKRLREAWHQARTQAFGERGDADAVDREIEAWRQAGVTREAELRLHHALIYSTQYLRVEQPAFQALAGEALATMDDVEDAALAIAFYQRLVGTLAVMGRADEARRHLADAKARFAAHAMVAQLGDFADVEIDRAAGASSLGPGRPAASSDQPGRLELVLDVTAPALAGARLLVSPGQRLAVDTPYARLPPATARDDLRTFVIERPPAEAPLRWVLVDAAGNTRASGVHWMLPGASDTHRIAVGAPRPPRRYERPRRAGDGRRRVIVVIPDCGDWRIVNHLRARGELPVLGALIADGSSGVLWSEPAFTGAAMQTLVHPRTGPPSLSLVGWAHEMGGELAGLSSVGENPLASLRWVLPEARDFFDVVGAGNHTAANLLFSHGALGAGRNARVFGPRGAERALSVERMERPLRSEERAMLSHPDAGADRFLRALASGADALVRVAQDASIDVALVRLEALDLITHDRFAAVLESRQDDAHDVLYDAYRYLDHRLADVLAHLDDDDVLIVASDHGILTALRHDPRALFVAAGAGVNRGRLPGRPAFAGLPGAVARAVGLEVPWPLTGVEGAFASPASAAGLQGTP